jgi:hypothetical protein
MKTTNGMLCELHFRSRRYGNRQYLQTLQIKALVHGVTPCSLTVILTEPFWFQCVGRTDSYEVIINSAGILESNPERAMKGTNDGDLFCGETKAQTSIWNVWIKHMNCRPTNGKARKTVFTVLLVITAWFIRHSANSYPKLRYLAISQLIRPQS